MKPKTRRIIGWVLSALLSAFLIVASATPKFTEWEGKEEMMAKSGWTTDTMFKVGIIEAAIAILFLIPRTAFVAAVLMTGYLGGAVATHVRVHEPFWIPILFGVLAWVALGLRDERVFTNAFQTQSTEDAL